MQRYTPITLAIMANIVCMNFKLFADVCTLTKYGHQNMFLLKYSHGCCLQEHVYTPVTSCVHLVGM